MVTAPPQSFLEALREYCRAHQSAVLFEEATETLFDVFSGKTLPLSDTRLARVEQRLDRDTQSPYLWVELADGRQLAITSAGVAFPPDFRNSGPVSLPRAVCFRDFRTLVDRVKHELYGHADRAPTREALQIVMMCIAILDGARAFGFSVGPEERELELHLSELEKRGVTLG